jgi:hypothetical protein
MTEAEIVAALDAVTGGGEEAHYKADEILLLHAVSPAVRAAYERIVERTKWWAFS